MAKTRERLEAKRSVPRHWAKQRERPTAGRDRPDQARGSRGGSAKDCTISGVDNERGRILTVLYIIALYRSTRQSRVRHEQGGEV